MAPPFTADASLAQGARPGGPGGSRQRRERRRPQPPPPVAHSPRSRTSTTAKRGPQRHERSTASPVHGAGFSGASTPCPSGGISSHTRARGSARPPTAATPRRSATSAVAPTTGRAHRRRIQEDVPEEENVCACVAVSWSANSAANRFRPATPAQHGGREPPPNAMALRGRPRPPSGGGRSQRPANQVKRDRGEHQQEAAEDDRVLLAEVGQDHRGRLVELRGSAGPSSTIRAAKPSNSCGENHQQELEVLTVQPAVSR